MKKNKRTEFFQTTQIIYKLMPLFMIGYIALAIVIAFYPVLAVSIEKSFFDQIGENIKSGWNSNANRFLIITLIIFLVLNFLVYLFYRLQAILDTFMINRLNKYLHLEIMKMIDRTKFEQFEHNEFYNELQLAITECSTGNIVMIHLSLIKLISLIITLVSLSIVLLKFSYIGLFLAIIASIPGFIHQAWFGKKNWEFNSSQVPLVRQMNYFLTLFTTPAFVKENKLYNTKDFYFGKYDNLFEKQHTQLKQLNNKHLWIGIVLAVLHTAGTVSVVLYAYFQALRSHISIGDAVLYAGAAHSIYNTMQSIIFNYGAFKTSQNNNTNILSFLNTKVGVTEDIKHDIYDIEKIDFRNVYFKYPNSERFVLEDVSFTLKTNMKYALVGENGSGKSTILKLLLRLYSPSRGNIYLNDIDIEDVSRESIARLFNCCFQDYFIYSFTIRENVTLGNADDVNAKEDVVNALKNSGLYDDLNHDINLDEYISKQFSNTGLVLSGGQNQKLALARTFFANKPILILDEPSASLDIVTEHQIFEYILANIDQKLVLFITHRLSNVIQTDNILLLKNGKIVDVNNHQELLKNNLYYRDLFYAQAKEYLQGDRDD